MKRNEGFTLIELMVVVAIIGIIAAVAIPSYQRHVIKSNRAAAESFMLQVASRQEQYILDARAYANSMATLGLKTPTNISNFYTVTTAAPTSTTFTVTANPINSQLSGDTTCGTLTLDQTGAKTPSTSGCW